MTSRPGGQGTILSTPWRLRSPPSEPSVVLHTNAQPCKHLNRECTPSNLVEVRFVLSVMHDSWSGFVLVNQFPHENPYSKALRIGVCSFEASASLAYGVMTAEFCIYDTTWWFSRPLLSKGGGCSWLRIICSQGTNLTHGCKIRKSHIPIGNTAIKLWLRYPTRRSMSRALAVNISQVSLGLPKPTIRIKHVMSIP